MDQRKYVRVVAFCCLFFGVGTSLRGMEHVTLRNGFELDCARREVVGERVRLYLSPETGTPGANYLEVAADAVLRVEALPAQGLEKQIPSAGSGRTLRASQDGNNGSQAVAKTVPTAAEMHEMLAHAGVAHRVDADLLASVVRAESGGNVAAVSRVGARGLMQLMPTTAAALGVKDAFAAEQNIDGGSAYLDALLTRYHDDIAVALAAYNAGPAAVDRWHGIPPYHETRAYVARVIREFNRRKLAER